jgi:hypothetical protein
MIWSSFEVGGRLDGKFGGGGLNKVAKFQTSICNPYSNIEGVQEPFILEIFSINGSN